MLFPEIVIVRVVDVEISWEVLCLCVWMVPDPIGAG